MSRNLLVCLADPALQQALLEKGEAFGFKAQGLPEIPVPEQLGALLPDWLMLDMDWIAEAGLLYLETIYESFPSIGIVILSDSRYQEEDLFLTLKSGAKGWLFKQEPEKILADLKSFSESASFLKPFVAQSILEEFKNFSSGEPLLPVEEEILRKAASGSTPAQIQKSLNLSKKFLKSHWESIWQKLNINARAQAEVESRPTAREDEAAAAPQPALPVEAFPPPSPAAPRAPEPPAPRQEESAPPREEPKAPPAQAPAREEKEGHAELLQLVTFRLGKEEFALNIVQLQEIQRMLPITSIPRVPAFVEGIVNLRGKIVPIIDLRKRLGIEAGPPTKDVRIMVVNVEDKIIGMIVDAVEEVLRTDTDAIEPPPPLVLRMDTDYIQGVINLEGRLILLLNASQIVHYEAAEPQEAGGRRRSTGRQEGERHEAAEKTAAAGG